MILSRRKFLKSLAVLSIAAPLGINTEAGQLLEPQELSLYEIINRKTTRHETVSTYWAVAGIKESSPSDKPPPPVPKHSMFYCHLGQAWRQARCVVLGLSTSVWTRKGWVVFGTPQFCLSFSKEDYAIDLLRKPRKVTWRLGNCSYAVGCDYEAYRVPGARLSPSLLQAEATATAWLEIIASEYPAVSPESYVGLSDFLHRPSTLQIAQKQVERWYPKMKVRMRLECRNKSHCLRIWSARAGRIS